MDVILAEEEIKKLKYLPAVELIDPKIRKYYVYNRLSENTPSFIFKGNDATKEAYVLFSCFVSDPKLIPRESVGDDDKTRKMWIEISSPGIFRLKHGEELYVQIPVKEEGQDEMKSRIAKVKINPDILLMDVFTSNILDGCDIQLIVNASNSLKVERITMCETDDRFDERQKFRRENILAVNKIIETHLSELAKLDTKQ